LVPFTDERDKKGKREKKGIEVLLVDANKKGEKKAETLPFHKLLGVEKREKGLVRRSNEGRGGRGPTVPSKMKKTGKKRKEEGEKAVQYLTYKREGGDRKEDVLSLCSITRVIEKRGKEKKEGGKDRHYLKNFTKRERVQYGSLCHLTLRVRTRGKRGRKEEEKRSSRRCFSNERFRGKRK